MKKRIFTFIAALMMVFVWTVTARAQIMGDLPTFFDVFFDITYGNAVEQDGTVMVGTVGLFYGSGNMYFPLAEPRPDPIFIKSGDSFFDVFRFDMDAVPADTGIYLSFNGGVFQPNDEPVVINSAYAFDVGTKSVESDPGVAPLIFLGNAGPDFLAEPRPDPFTLPIFAFASPGVQVGALRLLILLRSLSRPHFSSWAPALPVWRFYERGWEGERAEVYTSFHVKCRGAVHAASV